MLLILVIRGTVSVISEMPPYGWTYKHIGVVQYLQTFHALPPAADIYGQWPALFSLTAWFASLSGISLIAIALVFAPLIHILLALSVMALARVLGYSRRTALAAAMISETLNWVAQDYFAPQAIALVVALATLVVLLTSRRLRAASVLGVFLFASLIPLHQLTPYWLLLVMVALAVVGRIKPWWVVAVCAILLVAYLIPRYSVVSHFGLLSGLNPFENARSNVAAQGGQGKFITSLACRSLAASAFAAAGGATIALLRRRLPVWPSIAMVGCAVVLLGGVSYGGEAIFRVFLYSIPGLSILIAAVFVGFVRIKGSLTRQLVPVCVAVTGLLWFLIAGMQGYYGLWGQITVSRVQYDAARSVMNYEGDVRIIPLFSGGIPDRSSAQYVDKATRNSEFDTPLVSIGPGSVGQFPVGQLDTITEQAAHLKGVVYIAITEQDMRALEYYGYATRQQLNEFIAQIESNRYWQPVLVTPNLRLYQFQR